MNTEKQNKNSKILYDVGKGKRKDRREIRKN